MSDFVHEPGCMGADHVGFPCRTLPPVSEWVTCKGCGDLTPPFDIVDEHCVSCNDGRIFTANALEAKARSEPSAPFTGAEIADLHDYPSFIVQRLIATITDFSESVIRQWGYWSSGTGGYGSGGLSTLEQAFELRGWDDPHPVPEAKCDEPGCDQEATCGFPVKANEFMPAGYRRTCGPHYMQYRNG